MEISSFGAKANLPPKIRADLSGQAKHTSYLCLALSHTHTHTPFHSTDGNRRDEVSRAEGENWRMGKLQDEINGFILASRCLVHDFQLNAHAFTLKLTQRHTNTTYGVLTLSLFQLHVQPGKAVSPLF